MSDSEQLFDKEPDEISSLVTDLGTGVLKKTIGVFILFILISSTTFVDRVLYTIHPSYTDGRFPTGDGVIIQGATFGILYFILHVLISSGAL